jgi:hypothetical protein
MQIWLVCRAWEKGSKMKNSSVSVCKVILTVFFCAAVLWFVGCAQPGETTAEGHRRHLRKLRIDNQQMMEDIDTVMLTDQPSKLSDKRLP